MTSSPSTWPGSRTQQKTGIKVKTLVKAFESTVHQKTPKITKLTFISNSRSGVLIREKSCDKPSNQLDLRAGKCYLDVMEFNQSQETQKENGSHVTSMTGLAD